MAAITQCLAVRIEVEAEETRLAWGEGVALAPMREVVVVPFLLVGHPHTLGARNSEYHFGGNDHDRLLMRSQRSRSYS